MNAGGFPIVGIGLLIFICGYATESKPLMLIAALIFLAGFGLLAVKGSTGKNPSTRQAYFKCPSCGRHTGEEIPESKRENGKTYRCIFFNYKW